MLWGESASSEIKQFDIALWIKQAEKILDDDFSQNEKETYVDIEWKWQKLLNEKFAVNSTEISPNFNEREDKLDTTSLPDKFVPAVQGIKVAITHKLHILANKTKKELDDVKVVGETVKEEWYKNKDFLFDCGEDRITTVHIDVP
ncbi:17916_t:CDS:2 [Entrophospora sp. SA101]|nr:17916_t:CDS:2 [Entrophospora sp. SA101]